MHAYTDYQHKWRVGRPDTHGAHGPLYSPVPQVWSAQRPSPELHHPTTSHRGSASKEVSPQPQKPDLVQKILHLVWLLPSLPVIRRCRPQMRPRRPFLDYVLPRAPRFGSLYWESNSPPILCIRTETPSSIVFPVITYPLLITLIVLN